MIRRIKLLSVFFGITLLGAAVVRASGAKPKGEDLVYLKSSTVTVSSFDESPGGWAPPPNPMAMVDGDLKTRWASKSEDGQWVTLNLGTLKVVNQVVLHWERAFAVRYVINVSEDGKTWKTVFTMKKGQGDTETAAFPPVKAQFIQLQVQERLNPQWGVSIWELEPYGPRSENRADKPLGDIFPWRKAQEHRSSGVHIKLEKPLPSPGPLDPSMFQNGINYTSWHETELGTEISDKTLEYIKSQNVDYIAILTTWFMKNPDSKAIFPQNPLGGMTPVDNALKHVINKAHSLGMRVMLKPHVDLEDNTFRGNFYPVEGWFDSYRKFIKHYAKIAQEYNVEIFCVGTELKGPATAWENEKEWARVIKEVRQVYKGPLTYAANWDEYDKIPFWDRLDYIGLDAYFPLTDNPKATLPELVEGWERVADELEGFLQRKGLKQPLILTEAGYPSTDGAGAQPWIASSDVKNRQQQADCYEAVFRVLTKRPWFGGVYWWHYLPGDRPMLEDLTIRGKLAEQVMSTWYKKLSNGGSR